MAVHDLSDHAHHHNDPHSTSGNERRTLWVVLLTLAMMIVELLVGWWSGSMALTADGWHMGTHAGALGLALVAYWYARSRANDDAFTFGTGKVYALAGYSSALALGGVAIWMAVESSLRLGAHRHIAFGEALPVAILGLVVNVASVLLLGHGHDHDHDHDHGHEHEHEHDNQAEPTTSVGKPVADLNHRAAYLHVLADALTSIFAIAALCLGKWAGLWFLDPLMGLAGAIVIGWWAVGLARSAAKQLLDAVPSEARVRSIRNALEKIDDVKVADLHVWELGPGRAGCIVSLVTSTPRDVSYYQNVVRSAHAIAHLTIEVHRCSLGHSPSTNVQNDALSAAQSTPLS